MRSALIFCVVGLLLVGDQPNVSEGRDYLSMAEAWFNDHFLVITFTALFLTGLTIVALVAGFRRRRERR